MTDDQGDPSIFIARRAAQLAAEVERARGSKRASAAVVVRASQVVSALDACDSAELHGHRFLAYLLRRFVRELRTKPVMHAVED